MEVYDIGLMTLTENNESITACLMHDFGRDFICNYMKNRILFGVTWGGLKQDAPMPNMETVHKCIMKDFDFIAKHSKDCTKNVSYRAEDMVGNEYCFKRLYCYKYGEHGQNYSDAIVKSLQEQFGLRGLLYLMDFECKSPLNVIPPIEGV